ncbi:unnamed protein product [Prorocentrum cordatum]|uniref:Alpha-L-fucosidase n=1 Tax=Prorocentrum cordatum TaxID=2364126 RepID=A0ABN9RRR9_9DINO|nr:unnamed protein product [Polarella glacialis]
MPLSGACLLMRVHCLLLLFGVSEAAGRIELEVDNTGKYSIAVITGQGQSQKWFESEATELTINHESLTTKDGSLKLEGITRGNGIDASGAYQLTTLTWRGGYFVTSFRDYSNMIVFEQSFPRGIKGSTLNASDPYAARDDVSTAFPSFSTTSSGSSAGYLAFTGDMMGSGAKHGTGGITGIPTGVSGFGPTCFFDVDLQTSVVISSFSQFMAASNGKRENGIAYGLQGSITDIPPGYTLSFVIVASSAGGVNVAFEEWGGNLLRRYGKSREETYEDYSLQYLGYSTDNGAFYYYQTEGHAPKRGPPYTPGHTYEETLIDVKAYAVRSSIPYRYILLDSWWYYQGKGSGVKNWIGRPDVFPHGNDYLRNQTGWPIMGHNRYWAVDNVYAKQNGGDYDFVVEKKGEGQGFQDFAWPTEQRFWDDLLYNSSAWGLFMYEQDWLDTEYDNVRHLNLNATAARTWLMQMGAAAARNHLTIQYCMSHCRHIMQSLEIPAVTNARASGDYHAGGDQWSPLGTTGIFGWSVAVAATKDSFWSTDVQTGSPYGDHATIREPYNRLQAVVSTISKGPVAPSDKIGCSDSALILKSCASDGRLLQGDKPAMLIDTGHVRKAFNKGGPDGEVWATHTVLSGQTFGVVLSAKLKSDYSLSFAEAGMPLAPSLYVHYEANATNTIFNSSSIALKACDKWDFQLFAVSPALPGNGWTLLGEPSKWVPVSAARFQNLQYSCLDALLDCSASVTAVGSEGEKISVAWLAPPGIRRDSSPTVVDCVIPHGNEVSILVSSSNPAGRCITPARSSSSSARMPVSNNAGTQVRPASTMPRSASMSFVV